MSPIHRVAVHWGKAHYPSAPPFSPDERFPEYPEHLPTGREDNPAYRAVRGALRLLELDPEHDGTAMWNPLSGLIRPGETVVLKPNFIRDYHETLPEQTDCIITHGSIIRAVLDYVALALKGRGRIVIADAPQGEADFDRLVSLAGLDAMVDLYRRQGSVPVEVMDLRREFTKKIDGVIVGRTALPGDPAGYVAVNLGEASEFTAVGHLCHRLYGSDYDRGELMRHHHGRVHEYLLSKTVLDADVLINLPKLKTHKKVGLTVSLKNLVGVNGDKNWLPHHREGVPAEGGDQYATSSWPDRFEQRVLAAFKSRFPGLGGMRRALAGPAKRLGRRAFGDTDHGRIRSGNWHGNDTTWRMVLDLNRAVLYSDGRGHLSSPSPKRCFSLVDGIIAGEGNGPLAPDRRPAGVVIAGVDFTAVDLVCARVMGLDYTRLPMLREALRPHRFPLTTVGYADIHCVSTDPDYTGRLCELAAPGLAFRPHFGWTGQVELAPPTFKSRGHLPPFQALALSQTTEYRCR
ncbi:MAG: DUF362 domain-containing protein [Phycisphaerae bacterium]|jgi:uncharacterized protein (DUF362 family)